MPAFLQRLSLIVVPSFIFMFVTNAQTPAFNLFQQEKTLPANLKQYISEGSVYTLNETDLNTALQTKPAELLLRFHFENKDWEIELRATDLFSKGFFVKTADGGHFNYNEQSALHYKGKISGHEHSVAAVSIMQNEVIAVLADENGNINIGALRDPSSRLEATHIIFRESAILQTQPFACGADVLPVIAPNPLPQFSAALNTLATVNTEPLDLYLEADYSCFQGNGSNVTTTVNWATSLFNVVTTLYTNDSVLTKLSGIKVWNSTDPYIALTNTSTVLYAFASNMSSGFPGDLAHFLSMRGLGGGIAFINVLCSSAYNRVAVSGNLSSSFNPFPAYSWSTMVITHEMGHNIASNHTQWCGWPGGAIDNCYTTEGGCPAGPAPVNGGTIMSYCHLTGYGINLANGFGPLPGATIRNAVRNNTCIFPKISFSTTFQSVTEETADMNNGCLDYKLVNLKLGLNYTPSQPAIISMIATGVASPGLQIGANKDVELSTLNFTLSDTIPQALQLKVYDDAYIEGKESLKLDYTVAANGTNAVKSNTYQLDIISLDHRPDSTPNQVLYYEPFETINAGLGPWTQTVLYGASSPNRWVIGNNGDSLFPGKAAFVSVNGSTAGYAGSTTGDSAIVRLESPTINASGFSNMLLTYQYRLNGEGNTGQGIGGGTGNDFGSVYYSINNGASWVLLRTNIFGRNFKLQDEMTIPAAANNAASLKIAFTWQNNSSLVNNPPFIIDSIVIKGTGSSPVQRYAHASNIFEAPLGPNETIHFYNPVTQNIMASISNNSSFDFGCTNLQIVRTGDSAKVAWGDYAAQKISDKSYRVTTTNSNAGAPYEISLYYTPEEINGWTASTGNSAADMAIVKTAADITLAPPASLPEFSNYNSNTNFNAAGARVIKARFSGFGDFSIGKAGITPVCPGNTNLLSANETGLSYQWQVNSGPGYTNISNGVIYSGVTTATLSLTNAPTAWYGYKYRCIITDALGNHPSMEYSLKFAINWLGTANTAWENISNWGCLYLPDANTDVFIKPGAGLFPVVNGSTAIRSLTLLNGASVQVKNGVQLSILH